MVDGILYLLAKEPREGEVKTRLTPPLTRSQACRCHNAFVEDSLERLAAMDGIDVRLAAAPDDDAPWLNALAARLGVRVEGQGPGDLGERLRRLLARGVADGHPTVSVGADTPDLALTLVRAAFAALERVDVVVGPSDDGGYYAIGCRDRVPPLFHLDTGWGGDGVFDETLTRIRQCGATFEVLPAWSDVDDYSGLRALAARLRRGSGDSRRDGLAATRGLIDALLSEGVDL